MTYLLSMSLSTSIQFQFIRFNSRYLTLQKFRIKQNKRNSLSYHCLGDPILELDVSRPLRNPQNNLKPRQFPNGIKKKNTFQLLLLIFIKDAKDFSPFQNEMCCFYKSDERLDPSIER